MFQSNLYSFNNVVNKTRVSFNNVVKKTGFDWMNPLREYPAGRSLPETSAIRLIATISQFVAMDSH